MKTVALKSFIRTKSDRFFLKDKIINYLCTKLAADGKAD